MKNKKRKQRENQFQNMSKKDKQKIKEYLKKYNENQYQNISEEGKQRMNTQKIPIKICLSKTNKNRIHE